MCINTIAVADPGFPVGGMHPLGGHGPLLQVLFGENVCENKRIGSHRGACTRHTPLDLPMHCIITCGPTILNTTSVKQPSRSVNPLVGLNAKQMIGVGNGNRIGKFLSHAFSRQEIGNPMTTDSSPCYLKIIQILRVKHTLHTYQIRLFMECFVSLNP